MTQFKGTPGPWKCLREEVNKHYIRISSTKLGERFAVANVLIPLYDDIREREAKETRANAKLIAAAPELLEALQQCIPHLREQSKNDGHAFGTLQLVNRIINKATGETK